MFMKVGEAQQNGPTVFIRIVAAATINFVHSSVRLLNEGGYFACAHTHAVIDTGTRMHYGYT